MQENITGKKILLVISFQGFKDVEYAETREQLEKRGFSVEVASIQKGTAVGADGMEVEVAKTVNRVDPEGYAAVAFIGGPGMARIVEDDNLQALARNFYEADKVISAICITPVILAKAGLLEGKEATVFPDGSSYLEEGGARLQDKEVVVDGRIITGKGPSAALEFGKTLAENLKS